ncbi:uncharacterized protein LOC135202432 [Macrobrachium nipponense]|uniref:uncharacterized protein LOC135202432 n=1 Tax=Macrobrachium nipponense TaxID=159736 RepID=UPI0030C8ADC5
MGALSMPKAQPTPNKQQAGPSDTVPGNAAVPERMIDPILLYLRISEITGDRLFHLSCKVNVKKYLERDFNRLAVLRVCDGTRTSKNFRKWDIEESTEEYEDEVFAPANSEEIDIIVFTNVNRLDNVNVSVLFVLSVLDILSYCMYYFSVIVYCHNN